MKKQGKKYQVGDKVILRPDVMVRHAQSVPAHMGYTHEQFQWRDTLDKKEGKIGTIERIFPNSNHVNVLFDDGTLIGINDTELIKKDHSAKKEKTQSLGGITKAQIRKLGL